MTTPLADQLAAVGLECEHPDMPCTDTLCRIHGDPQLISQAEYMRLIRIEKAARRFAGTIKRTPIMLHNPEWFNKEFEQFHNALR